VPLALADRQERAKRNHAIRIDVSAKLPTLLRRNLARGKLTAGKIASSTPAPALRSADRQFRPDRGERELVKRLVLKRLANASRGWPSSNAASVLRLGMKMRSCSGRSPW